MPTAAAAEPVTADKPARAPCVHEGCGNMSQPRKRGLCHRHYHDLSVREQHPRQIDHVSVPDGPSLEPVATAGTRPKSAEDFAEKARRAKLRQAVFSKKDGAVDLNQRLREISFGDRIRRLRQRKGWTFRELARRAELDVAAVARLEQGKFQPRTTTVKKLAVALGEPVAALLG